MLTPGTPNSPRSDGPAHNLPDWAVEPRQLEQTTERAALPVIQATQRTPPLWRWPAKPHSSVGSKIKEVLIRWGIISPPKPVRADEVAIPLVRLDRYRASFLKRFSPLFGGDIEGRLRYEWKHLNLNDLQAVSSLSDRVALRLEALRGLLSASMQGKKNVEVQRACEKRIAQTELLLDELTLRGGDQEGRLRTELLSIFRENAPLPAELMAQLDTRRDVLSTLDSQEIRDERDEHLKTIQELKIQAIAYQLEREVRVEGNILAVVRFVDFARQHGFRERAETLIQDLKLGKIQPVIERMKANLSGSRESEAGLTTLEQIATLHAITGIDKASLNHCIQEYLNRLNKELNDLSDQANLANTGPILKGIKRAYEHAEQIKDFPLSETDFQLIHAAIHEAVNTHLLKKIEGWKEEKQQPLQAPKEAIDTALATYAPGIQGTLPEQVGVALAAIQEQINGVSEELAPFKLELEQFEQLNAQFKELEKDRREIEQARSHSLEAAKRMHDAEVRLAELNDELHLLTIEYFFLTELLAGRRDTVRDEATKELERYEAELSEELKLAMASEVALEKAVASGEADPQDLVALKAANQQRPDMQAWVGKQKFIQEIQKLAGQKRFFEERRLKSRLTKIQSLQTATRGKIGVAEAECKGLQAVDQEGREGIKAANLRKEARLREIEQEIEQKDRLVAQHAPIKGELEFRLNELERYQTLIGQVKETFVAASSRSTSTMALIQLLDLFIQDFNLEQDVKTQATERLNPQSTSYLEGVAQYFKSLGLDPEKGRKLASEVIGDLRDQLINDHMDES